MKEIIFQQIMRLVSYNFNFMEIGERIYVYQNIEFSMSGSATSIDYNSIQGIDITTFLQGERLSTFNDAVFLKEFQNYIEKKEFIRIRFNKLMPYYTYSK